MRVTFKFNLICKQRLVEITLSVYLILYSNKYIVCMYFEFKTENWKIKISLTRLIEDALPFYYCCVEAETQIRLVGKEKKVAQHTCKKTCI